MDPAFGVIKPKVPHAPGLRSYDLATRAGRYSPPKISAVDKIAVAGDPDIG